MPDSVNQKLVDQYTEIARLAGGLAHEIKNPLSTIRLNMELLAEDFAAEPENPLHRRALTKVKIVQRECQRLQDLLDDFLSFAKVRRLKLEPTSLNHQVTPDAGLLRAQGQGVEDRGDRLPRPATCRWCCLDREAFHGALLNLVLNAQQAMPNGGQLVVRTFVTGRRRGPGPDRHRLRHGRARRRRTSSRPSISTKRGGSGLGLPTARKIIEAHGGQILVQSEPRRGTRFTIKLPVPARLPPGAVIRQLPSSSAT